MRIRVDQALFGYDRGHRLIASSTKIDKEAQWVLRGLTDMRFGGRTRRCLTVLPIATLSCHAFIRTWPAGASFRPGSVWSHVLLVPTTDLSDLSDFRFLDAVFRRPHATSDADLAAVRSDYTGLLTVEVNGDQGPPEDVSDDVMERLVSAAYGSEETAEVVTDEAGELDIAVLGLLGQQWPTLRERFAVRTRYRQSAASVAAFDVQVLERPSGKIAPTRSARAIWSDVLSRDLRKSNLPLRAFLLRFGPAGPYGRLDVSALAHVFAAASQGDVQQATAVIEGRYPEPETMSELKIALLGPPDEARDLLPGWPKDEFVRVRALLAMQPSSVSYSAMRVGERLAVMIKRTPEAAGAWVNSVLWSDIDPEQRGEIVTGLAAGLDTAELVATGLEHTDLVPELLALRADLWGERGLWLDPRIDHGVLLELFAALPTTDRDDVFRLLLLEGLADAGREVADVDPGIWWAALAPAHAADIASSPLAISTASRLLAVLGAERLTDRGVTITTRDQMMVVLRTSDPDDGIWRSGRAEVWIDLTESAARGDLELASESLERLWVIALAAGVESGSGSLRRRAWSATFGALHEELAGGGPPSGSHDTLVKVLPKGPGWDWCARLRHGLAEAAARDDWSERERHNIAASAGAFAADVEARYRQLTEHHGESLLDGLRHFFGI